MRQKKKGITYPLSTRLFITSNSLKNSSTALSQKSSIRTIVLSPIDLFANLLDCNYKKKKINIHGQIFKCAFKCPALALAYSSIELRFRKLHSANYVSIMALYNTLAEKENGKITKMRWKCYKKKKRVIFKMAFAEIKNVILYFLRYSIFYPSRIIKLFYN